MYRNREDVIAFKQFAVREIESLPPLKLKETMNREINNHVLNSVDFDRRLVVKQLQMLDKVMFEASAFFSSLSDYLDTLRMQLKKDYLERRIEPGQ